MSATCPIQQLNRDLADKLIEEAKQNPQSPYMGKFVGIANGQIVVVADDLDEVARRLDQVEPDPNKTFWVEVGQDTTRFTKSGRSADGLRSMAVTARPARHPGGSARPSGFRQLPLPPPQFFGYTPIMNKTANGRVLHRLLDPVSSSLNEEAARKLIGLKADRQAQARVAKLARKCNEGELTAEERDEYEMYVMVGEFIAILQAKARVVLARRSQPV